MPKPVATGTTVNADAAAGRKLYPASPFLRTLDGCKHDVDLREGRRA